MAEALQYDEHGNLIDPNAPAPTSFWNPAPGSEPSLIPDTSPTVNFGGQELPNVTGQNSTPAPAPSTGAPQLPEFGMGNMNMPPPPTFDQPSDESLTQAGGNGLSQDDQNMKNQASAIYGMDPGAPGGRYSGGSGRKANPLRDSPIGKRFMGASKAGTAYGNAFDQEGLLGGGKNAQLAGGDNAELGQQPSDLLLQMLQLLSQQG